MELVKIYLITIAKHVYRSHKIYLVLVHTYIIIAIPPGFVVSAIPLLTLTHSRHLIYGSG